MVLNSVLHYSGMINKLPLWWKNEEVLFDAYIGPIELLFFFFLII